MQDLRWRSHVMCVEECAGPHRDRIGQQAEAQFVVRVSQTPQAGKWQSFGTSSLNPCKRREQQQKSLKKKLMIMPPVVK